MGILIAPEHLSGSLTLALFPLERKRERKIERRSERER
jgi:hypothetical protein